MKYIASLLLMISSHCFADATCSVMAFHLENGMTKAALLDALGDPETVWPLLSSASVAYYPCVVTQNSGASGELAVRIDATGKVENWFWTPIARDLRIDPPKGFYRSSK